MTCSVSKVRVCHVAMADLWAGAEVQLAILLRSLARRPDLEVSAILFNGGWLAGELENAGVPTLVIREAERNPMAIVRELRERFRRERIDVLHTHKYKDNMLSALASIGRGGPYQVRTIHGAREPFVGVAFRMNVYERQDSHDILGLRDLFVLPSLSEGIPLVLLEALALSRPVVATNVGGIPEVVEDGCCSGVLVPAGRPDELARGCLTVMDNPALAQRLGQAGRARVEDAFFADAMAEKVAQIYRTLVGPRENS